MRNKVAYWIWEDSSGAAFQSSEEWKLEEEEDMQVADNFSVKWKAETTRINIYYMIYLI